MTVLTADRKTERKQGAIFGLPVAASAQIYSGAMLNVDSGGYLTPAGDIAGETFVGVAKQAADNSSGANGDITCEGYLKGVFQMNGSGFTQADLVKEAYVVDDNTIGFGIAVQPTNVTGVVVSRISTSRGGTMALAFSIGPPKTLSYGGGTAVNVSSDGDYVLTATDGSEILATVTSASLPGSDQSDNLQLRYVRVGRIIEVVSSSSAFVDISKAARS